MTKLKVCIVSLLRRSERLFKTDMVYLAKGGFWLTLTQVVSAVASFVLAVAFAHLFPKESYGTYKYVVSLAGIIGTLTLSGLSTAVTQSVARGYDGSFKDGYKANLIWGLGMVAVSFIAAIYYFFHHNLLLAFSLVFIGVTAPLLDAAGMFSSYLAGKKEFKAISLLNILQNVLPGACLIVALLLAPNDYVIISVYFVVSTLAVYVAYWYTLHHYRPTGQSDPAMMSYAKHLSALGILNAIADQIDSVIVYHYLGAVDLAIYTFATAIPTQIKGVLKGVSSLAFPKFANRNLTELKREMPGKMFRLFCVCLVVVAIYLPVAPYIYRWFFPAYTDAIRLSQVFALSLLAFASSLPSTALQAQKTIKSLYGANFAMAVTKITLLFVGVLSGGLWGVVYARIAYEIAGVIIASWYLARAKVSA